MLECKICGTKFNAIIEHHYEVLYDSFDCPMCGCQVIAKERKRTFVPYTSDKEGKADE